MTLLKDTIRCARKHHACGAWYWFDRSCYGPQDITPDDWLIVEAARADRGRILPGQEYIYQVSVDGDGFREFRARKDMHRICMKYDLYPED
jgi:hypothetical protein